MAYYNPKHNPSQYKYNKEKLKRVPLDLQNEYYTTTLLPACQEIGLPTNTFIKQAIAHYIEHIEKGEIV